MVMHTRIPPNPELTAIAIAWSNSDADLIADLVMFRCPEVGTSTFKWLEHDLAQGYTIPDSRVGRRGRVTQVEFKAEEKAAETADYGLEDAIPQDDIDAGLSRKINVRGQSVEYLTKLITLDREVRVAAMVQNADNYAAANVEALSGSDKWTDATAKPLDVLHDMLNGMPVRANTLTMSRTVWSKFRRHPNVVKAIYPTGTGVGSVTRQQVIEELEIQNLYIGGAFVNTARKGQTANLAQTWGPHVALHYQDKAASARQGVTWGLTVPYGKRVAKDWPEEHIGLRGGVVVRVGESLRELVLAPAAGALIQNVI